MGALGSTIENIAHIYVAVPAELATFVMRALAGGGSRSSFSDEATTQRRVLPGSAPSPESLAAVSTPLSPEPAPVIATPLPSLSGAERSGTYFGVPVPADPSESMGAHLPAVGMGERRRWTIVSVFLLRAPSWLFSRDTSSCVPKVRPRA